MLIHHRADIRRIGDFYFLFIFLGCLKGDEIPVLHEKDHREKIREMFAMLSVNFARLATKG